MTTVLEITAAAVRRAPIVVIAAVLALTGVLGFVTTRSAGEVVGGVDAFATDTPAARTADRITELFGDAAAPDQVVAQLIVTEADGDVLDAGGVARAAALRSDLLADPAVAAAIAPQGPGVVTWADLVLGGAAGAGLDPTQLDDASVDALQLAALEGAGDAAAGVVGLIGSPNEDVTAGEAGMVLVVLDGAAGPEVVADARAAVNARAGAFADHDVHTFDLEALMVDASGEMQTEMGRLLGVAFLLIVLILVAIYRRAVDVITSLVGLGITLVWSQGINVLLGPDLLGITGGASDMAMAIPILLVGLGVDYGIHLTMRAREEAAAGAGVDEATGRSITAVGSALTLATVTTVVGFATNIVNPLPPLRDFGLFAAAGVVAAFVVMVTFVPSVRLLAERRRARRAGATGRRGPGGHEVDRADGVEGRVGPTPQDVGLLGRAASAIAPVAVRRPGLVLGVAGLLTVALGLSATGLSTEFSQTDFFAEGSRALETVELVDEHYGAGLDERTRVLLEPAPDDATLAAYVAGLATIDDVRTFDGQVAVQPRVSPDGGAVLLELATSAGEDAAVLVADLDRLAAGSLTPTGVAASVTSTAIMTDEILVALRDSQVKGLLITLLASMLILAVAFGVRSRAPMLGVLAIASVGIVTVWVLGLMALVGIPFNVMTAMVSSLAIGIGVPFSIHVVNRFLEDLATHDDTLTAMRHTLANTGGALIGSAGTTVAGFGVLMLASIPPMQQFGLVTAVTIALALVSSLAVLPAMLALWVRAAERGLGAGPAGAQAGDQRTFEPIG